MIVAALLDLASVSVQETIRTAALTPYESSHTPAEAGVTPDLGASCQRLGLSLSLTRPPMNI